jgi:REP element-mobilizing transposase RayT
VTLCAYRHRQLLATTAVSDAFIRFTERAYAKHNIAVGRYVIMPDHVHFFVAGILDANSRFAQRSGYRMLRAEQTHRT